MITSNNTQTPELNVETLLAVGCLNHSTPEEEDITKTIVYSDLTQQDKDIYDNYFGLSNYAFVTIQNTSCYIGIDRITSAAIVIDNTTIDYSTMSVQDKAIVDLFIDLLLRV